MTQVTPPRIVTTEKVVIELPNPANWQEVSLALGWANKAMVDRDIDYSDDLWYFEANDETILLTMEVP